MSKYVDLEAAADDDDDYYDSITYSDAELAERFEAQLVGRYSSPGSSPFPQLLRRPAGSSPDDDLDRVSNRLRSSSPTGRRSSLPEFESKCSPVDETECTSDAERRFFQFAEFGRPRSPLIDLPASPALSSDGVPVLHRSSSVIGRRSAAAEREPASPSGRPHVRVQPSSESPTPARVVVGGRRGNSVVQAKVLQSFDGLLGRGPVRRADAGGHPSPSQASQDDLASAGGAGDAQSPRLHASDSDSDSQDLAESSADRGRGAGSRGRCWIFVLNCGAGGPGTPLPDPQVFLKFLQQPRVRYVIFQQERAAHDHFQGYIQFSSALRFNTIKSIFNPYNPRLEQARGSLEDNQKYCTKDDTRVSGPYTFGKPEGKGKRNDLHNTLVEFRQDVMSGALTRDAAPWHPKYCSLYLRNREHMSKLFLDSVISAAPRRAAPPRWHPWQQAIIDIVQSPPDDRTVYWIYDKDGGVGKTYLSEYLVSNELAYSSPVIGKFGDIMHQWIQVFADRPRAIIIDVPRDVGENTNVYAICEKYKDGSYRDTKYHGGLARWSPTHVFVFANDVPTLDRLSKDRLENSMFTIVAHPVTGAKELRALPYSACKSRSQPSFRVTADVDV